MSRTFRGAAAACPALRAHYRPGLQALKGADRRRVRGTEPNRLGGSVDLDAALRRDLPNARIWDYGIGYRSAGNGDDVVHWVEVHPATDRDVADVEAKLEWLKAWIQSNAPELARLDRRFVWVSSGRTQLSPTSPALRRLAQKGCRCAGGHYNIR